MRHVWIVSSEADGILGVYSSERVARDACRDLPDAWERADWHRDNLPRHLEPVTAYTTEDAAGNEITMQRYPVVTA